MTGRHRCWVWVLTLFAALALPAVALGAAGDPDTSFNGTGTVTTGFGTTPFHAADSGNAAARDGSSRIYIAGTTPANNGDLALVRLTAAGAVDTTFGDNGTVTTDLSGSGSEDQGAAVSVDSSGNVVVAGTTDDVGTSDDKNFAVVRYTSAGALDSSFGGGDGIVITDLSGGGADTASAVALPASGDIVVAGTTDSNPDPDITSTDVALVAYTSTGALDTNFDGDGGSGNGKVTTDFGSDNDFAQAMLVTSGPKILVAGGTDPTGDDRGDFALARYDAATGVLDNTFGTGGKRTVSFSSNPGGSGNGDSASALTTDSSGRILVAGFAGPGNGDFAVARLDATSGTPDNTFDSDGKQTVSSPSSPPTVNSQDLCFAVAVQADNKIVLAGTEFSSPHWMLARMSDTGVPDAGFGTGGISLTDFGPTSSSTTGASAVFVDAADIVAAGTADDNLAAARYTIADGALDPTFGTGSSGKVEIDVVSPTPSSEAARGVAVQPDGKIVVVGSTDAGPTSQFRGDADFGVSRYLPGGGLDPSFGGGSGRVTTNFADGVTSTGSNDTPSAVAIQPDGKILVAGTTDPPGTDTGDFALARYLPDGTPDPGFGTGGLVTTDIGGVNGDSASGVATTGAPGSAGFRIVVAGTESLAGQNTAVAVAAYQEDGTPDPTFNGGQQTTNLTSVYPTAGVAIQPDGKVLVAATQGGFFPPGPTDFALVRYTTAGALDPAFGGGTGQVITDFAGGFDQASSIAVRDLGSGQVRIVVGGRASPDTGFTGDDGIAVYTTDGSLDPSFAPGGPDGDGKLTFDTAAANNLDAIRGLAFQGDGKLVGAGAVGTGDFGVMRVTSAGALDPSFGGDGLVSTTYPDPAFLQYAAWGVAVQPDGKIVAAGGAFNPSSGSDFLVARYAADSQPGPPAGTPPVAQPVPTKTTKKKCKKKKHRAAAAKKCKKKK
jgi:uncharacterized delta-60 repeat protein